MKLYFHTYIYCLIIAFCFITFFSASTSWLYHNVEYLDADFFSVIGKYWAKGNIPYVDLWDQKGPIIYFFNAVGYFVTGQRWGVYLIQIISLTITLYYTYYFLLLEFSRKNALFLLLAATLALLNDYSYAGNNVEEYLLPLLTFAFYKMYKWLHNTTNDKYEHPYKYAFTYGMVFGFSFLTRMTNAIGVCGGIFIITILLLSKKQWKNLFHNILAFISGTGVIVIPFIIYFYCHGCLDEMIYGTLLYNIEYAKNAPELDPFSLNQTLYLFKSAINGITLFVISIFILFWHKNKLRGVLWGSVAIISLMWLMSGNGFHHYFIITYPFFCIIVNELMSLYKENFYKAKFKRYIIFYIVLLCCACTYETYGAYKTIKTKNTNLSFYNIVNNDLPKKDRNSFVAYNVSPYIYLYLDIKPCCRFFAYQDSQASFGNSLKEKISNEYINSSPKWILVNGDKTLIDNILNQKYKIIKLYPNNMKLYKLKTHNKL